MQQDANATVRGRPITHDVMTGLAVTAGAVALSALLASAFSAREAIPETYSDYEDPEAEALQPAPRQTAFAFVWPPLFLALTFSGLRIWSGPRSKARTQALALWGLAQALNTVWMAFGPSRLGGRVATTVASVGTAGAYAWRARRAQVAKVIQNTLH